MESNIYMQLLEEGTKVYRLVPAFKIGYEIYEIRGFEIYDKEDEIWEFPPGTCVLVKEQYLEGQNVLVAIKKRNPI